MFHMMEVEKEPEGKSKKPSFNQENSVACLTVNISFNVAALQNINLSMLYGLIPYIRNLNVCSVKNVLLQ